MFEDSDIIDNPGLLLRRMTADSLEMIRDQWTAIAGEDEFEVLLSSTFEGIEEDLSKVGFNVPVHAYLLAAPGISRKDGVQVVDAILELTDTKRGMMTKLLTVHVSPEYIGWDSDSELRSKVTSVYSKVLAYVISLGQERSSESDHELKIYGRNNAMLELLKEVEEKWQLIDEMTPEFDTWAKIKGRWLEITFRHAKTPTSQA